MHYWPKQPIGLKTAENTLFSPTPFWLNYKFSLLAQKIEKKIPRATCLAQSSLFAQTALERRGKHMSRKSKTFPCMGVKFSKPFPKPIPKIKQIFFAIRIRLIIISSFHISLLVIAH